MAQRPDAPPSKYRWMSSLSSHRAYFLREASTCLNYCQERILLPLRFSVKMQHCIMGREVGLGFNQNFSPLLALRHCVNLSKFHLLPGLLFLSCECHATFGLFAANFVGKSILGSVIKKETPGLLAMGGTLVLRPHAHFGSALTPLVLISSSSLPALLSLYTGTAWPIAFKTAF